MRAALAPAARDFATRNGRVRVLFALALAACGPVDADHPYDPATPAAEQVPSRITGRLVAPAGDAADYTGAEATLTAGEATAPAYTSPVDVGGRFRFDAVTPGLYRFEATAAELAADPIVLSIPAGQRLDLGAIALEPVLGVLTGEILDPSGAPIPQATAAIATERAAADAAGRFRLVAPAGDHPLAATAPGHAPTERRVTVRGQTVTALDAPLVLTPLPATITGRVRLRAFETPLRLAACAARLTTDAGEATAPVDPEGRYRLEAPAPGPATLTLACPGYDPATRALTLAPGDLTLDPIDLQHAAQGPAAVPLAGRVTDTQAPLAAVAVEITLAPAIPYARVLTDRDGRFTAPAAPDEPYRLHVTLDGYAPLDAGPYHHDPAADAFVDDRGDPPALRLTPLP
ncbi:MAG: carboxypeptidase-like regulatory domain-containing protein [bacterium]